VIVEAQVTIQGSKAAIWAAMTDIEHAATILSGVKSIEMVDKPASGLIGMKWRETRVLFGKEATAEKRITEAVANEYYKTQAEDGGFVFVTTMRIADAGAPGPGGGATLTGTHDSIPQTFGARLMSIPMALFFKGMIRKAALQDLNDIKSTVEAQGEYR
jgi:hypothetical protein